MRTRARGRGSAKERSGGYLPSCFPLLKPTAHFGPTALRGWIRWEAHHGCFLSGPFDVLRKEVLCGCAPSVYIVAVFSYFCFASFISSAHINLYISVQSYRPVSVCVVGYVYPAIHGHGSSGAFYVFPFSLIRSQFDTPPRSFRCSWILPCRAPAGGAEGFLSVAGVRWLLHCACVSSNHPS